MIPGTADKSRPELVSIIVNNFNYGRFVADAIDSALAQTYAPVEVVVVDDGSTDDSCSVIEAYQSRILMILKENGGQGSAFNAGFAASHGDFIIFLDADDMLLPTAVERAVGCFADGVTKVHWPLREIDIMGTSGDRTFPGEELPQGDLREFTFREGPSTSISSPTSGNAWARSFLNDVLPMPEPEHRIGADAFLFGLAPAFGEVRRIEQPQGQYRVHGNNNYRGRAFEDRLLTGLCSMEEQWRVLESHMRRLGRDADQTRWEGSSYFHRLRGAMQDIDTLVRDGETIILADEEKWGVDPVMRGRRFLPFVERYGQYWGNPVDDAEALRELSRMRTNMNATKLVIAWPAFWWLDYYPGFAGYLLASCTCLLQNENVMIFGLDS